VPWPSASAVARGCIPCSTTEKTGLHPNCKVLARSKRRAVARQEFEGTTPAEGPPPALVLPSGRARHALRPSNFIFSRRACDKGGARPRPDLPGSEAEAGGDRPPLDAFVAATPLGRWEGGPPPTRSGGGIASTPRRGADRPEGNLIRNSSSRGWSRWCLHPNPGGRHQHAGAPR